MVNLILCGGAGTRLWPLSRTNLPKQFYPLINGRSLFEETVLRNKVVCDRLFVASAFRHANLVERLTRESGVQEYKALLEPVGRNTAPAIALVCQHLNADDVVLVTPSDHLMTDLPSYHKAVAQARELAGQGYLVLLGIPPSYPETGYGYIEANGETVLSFREKPELALAQEFVASGRFLWNCGVFVFRAGVLLAEMERYAPDVTNATRGVASLSPTKDEMEAIPSISLDYAVMEHSDKIRVVPCDPGWSDLGSFESLYEGFQDGDSNVLMGTQRPLALDSSGNLVVSAGRKIVLLGVDDLMVVDTPDALLVTRRGSGQRVKEVIEVLKTETPELLE